ncbi:MAG: thiosulfohydrolase SoxB, partial [Rhodoferax sp.]|nr:thiosulfohydrolase SoxB [Rhodoferax sp.]
VRIGGLTYACEPGAEMGKRIQDMRLAGKPIEADKTYKVAGWAPVSEEAAKAGNKQVWEVIEPWLKAKGTVAARKPNLPRLIGVDGNPGLA